MNLNLINQTLSKNSVKVLYRSLSIKTVDNVTYATSAKSSTLSPTKRRKPVSGLSIKGYDYILGDKNYHRMKRIDENYGAKTRD